jgi:hypothetical protein
MGISACSVAVLLALLGLLVDFTAGISSPGIGQGERLTVDIQRIESEPEPNTTFANEVVPTLPGEENIQTGVADSPQEIVTVHIPEPSTAPQPVKDWHAIAERAARSSVDDYIENAESRASLWRQSHSVMFESDGALAVTEEAAIISDLRFKPEIHVVGFGVTIGSCFIGIPLVGVPVEQRTAEISIFVCAGDSG